MANTFYRFTTLYKLPNNLYCADSPILISAGNLLQDSNTGNILAQIKFQSFSEKKIKKVSVKLSAFDDTGKKISGITNYSYTGLSVKLGEFFGSDKAIVFYDNSTCKYEIIDFEVVFEDQTIWILSEHGELKQIENDGDTNYEKIYHSGIALMKSANTEKQLINIAEQFKIISGYNDADVLALECEKRAKEIRDVENAKIFDGAIEHLSSNNLYLLESALKKFESLNSWKDCTTQINICKEKIKAIKDEEQRNQRKKRILPIIIGSVVAVVLFIVLIVNAVSPKNNVENSLYYGNASYALEVSDLEGNGNPLGTSITIEGLITNNDVIHYRGVEIKIEIKDEDGYELETVVERIGTVKAESNKSFKCTVNNVAGADSFTVSLYDYDRYEE